jgi:hypothetical protein
MSRETNSAVISHESLKIFYSKQLTSLKSSAVISCETVTLLKRLVSRNSAVISRESLKNFIKNDINYNLFSTL